MHEPCGAKTRAGGNCTNPPVRGATRCRMHGGNLPQVKAKAERERTANNARRELTRIYGEAPPETVDPAEALMNLVREKHWEVARLRAVVEHIEADTDADLSDSPLVYGLVSHETGVGPEGPIDKRTFKAEPNVWLKLLREAEAQLADYTTRALRAGVERRQLELQEAQAVHLASAINRILDALELSAEQQSKVPEIVSTTLRALPVEGREIP